MMFSIPDANADLLPGALDAPGGFAWWYADLLDDSGNGVVLIPAWGLPFLPGYAGAARRGAAPPPLRRPSLAVSVYQGGRPAYYLVHELRPQDTSRDGHALRFGDSTLEFDRGSLRAVLDLPGPGGRLKGEVLVDGVPRRPVVDCPTRHPEHEWAPLCGPARGSWNLGVGGRRWCGDGSAYLDRNAGLAHLEALGIGRWTWARAQLPDRLRVGYAVWTPAGLESSLIVDVMGDGTPVVRPAVAQPARSRRNAWGLRWWPSLTLVSGAARMEISVRHRPDNGPFYLRHLCEVRTEVGDAPGMGEVCESARVDVAWQRPLVQMAVQRQGGPNSMFLPLFSGPAEGRLPRWVRGW
ncbi:MAG: hypothetical protein JXX28_12140 [Deltaproteobacteria bacterium]|nr:hypothetical protein [Deltaproteobacteria bacterium]